MYKKLLILLFLLVLSVFIANPVFADENFKTEVLETITDSSGANELDSAVSEDFSFSDTMNEYLSGGQVNTKNFFTKFTNLFFKEIKDNVSLALKVIIVALCCCIMQLFLKDTASYIPDISFYVCYMVIFIFCMKSLTYVSGICKNAIDSMQFFMQSAIPVLGSVLAGSGKNISVAPACFAIASICGACSVLSGILLPLGKMCAVAGGVSGLGINFGDLVASVKKAVLWALGILMTVFTAFVSIQGFAASAADNVALKTAKFTAGSVIPVIGGTVSDTLESVLACGSLVKNAAGAASVAAMIYICLSPILKILAVIIAYRFAVIMISPFSDSRIISSVNGFLSSLQIFLAFVIASCLMFIICAGIICKI